MSNMAFDNLLKKAELVDAHIALRGYQTALKTPGLSEDDTKFLNRAIELTHLRIENARYLVGQVGA